MSNEIRISSNFQVVKDNLQFSRSGSFQADMDGEAAAPSPGRVTATEDGADVDLSLITTPGVCLVKNLDDTNYITIGVWNPDQSEFYPVLELLPGEQYPLRLSRLINEEFSGTGTGTSGELNTLRVKGANAPCEVEFYVFEK